MRSILNLPLCLLVLIQCAALRAESDVRIQYQPGDTPLVLPPDESPSVWHRFQEAFEDSSYDVFADRLHPFQLLRWTMDQRDGLAAGLGDSANHAASGSLNRAAVYGLREAALELPFFRWMKENQNFLVELLRSTIDATAEEAVSPLDPSYGLVERSWWRRLSEGDKFRYGIRPFRTDPYVFVSFRLKDSETIPLLGHVRYYFRDWHEPKAEFAVSLPLPQGFAIDAGTSYEFAAKENEHKFVVKLFKQFKSGGIIHVGLESKHRPVMLAGIAFPW